MISGRLSKEQRATLIAQTRAVLTPVVQYEADIIAEMQRRHFPATVGWRGSSLDNTVGKWVRAALRSLRKEGKAELVRGKGWRCVPGGES